MCDGPPVRRTTILPFQVESGKIVVLRFRNLQTIAGEHQRRFDARRRLDAHREGRLVAEDDRIRDAAANQRETRLRLDDAPASECHRLEIPLRATGSQAGALEMVGDVFGGLRCSGLPVSRPFIVSFARNVTCDHHRSAGC